MSNIVESYKQEEKDISLQLTDRSEHYVQLVANDDRKDKIANMLQKYYDATKMVTKL